MSRSWKNSFEIVCPVLLITFCSWQAALPADPASAPVPPTLSAVGQPADIGLKIPGTAAASARALKRPSLGTNSPVQRQHGNDQRTISSPTQIYATPSLQPWETTTELDRQQLARPHAQMRAVTIIRYAMSLAERGAIYAAQQEFSQALTLIAQELDTSTGSTAHRDALAAAFTAFEEAMDFTPEASAAIAQIDVQHTARLHRTDALNDEQRINPQQAAERYYRFAQRKLKLALASDRAASAALYGLGRVEHGKAGSASSQRITYYRRAAVLFETALQIDATNYLASNELAVVLARGGQWRRARTALEQSMGESQRPESWYNLAKIHQRLGDQQRAKVAFATYTKLYEASANTGVQASAEGTAKIRWVTPAVFAGQSPTSDFGRFPAHHPAALSAEPQAKARTAKKSAAQQSPKRGVLSDLGPSLKNPFGIFRIRGGSGPKRVALTDKPAPGSRPNSPRAKAHFASNQEALPAGDLPIQAHGHSQPACCPSTIGPGSPCPVEGFHCIGCTCGGFIDLFGWAGAGPIPWEIFAHGEYIGPHRIPHVPEYRLRTDDRLNFVFRLTRTPSKQAYRLQVGDVIRVESLTSPDQNRDAVVQPDGAITLRLLGQVPAAGRTIDELRALLDTRYKEFVLEPTITVTPVKIDTELEELRATVDSRAGFGGQSLEARVTPEGTVQLPAIGSVVANGLTLDELQREIDARYETIVAGFEVTPILLERAPRYVYVLGEVANPGRFEMVAPTTVMQSIALAGSWDVGAALRHVVVFRRDEMWQLMATKLNIRPPLYGTSPCPAGEIWLRDSDIVLVPKQGILVADEVIELVFTRGIYGVFPLVNQVNFSKLSTI